MHFNNTLQIYILLNVWMFYLHVYCEMPGTCDGRPEENIGFSETGVSDCEASHRCYKGLLQGQPVLWTAEPLSSRLNTTSTLVPSAFVYCRSFYESPSLLLQHWVPMTTHRRAHPRHRALCSYRALICLRFFTVRCWAQALRVTSFCLHSQGMICTKSQGGTVSLPLILV